MIDSLRDAALQVFLSPEIWLIVILSAVYGVFMGAVPGLTATMAVALFVPVSYWLEPTPALAAVVTMVACAIFAGDIPTVLLRIPGTPASAAYVDDAYALTLRGESRRVLHSALLCSVMGGLVGAVLLMTLGNQLARIATMFSVVEYFWLYLLGLSCAVVVSQGSALRAMVGLMIGLLLSTVGLSAVHTEARFTFGQPELFQGISFIPAMIGLFGISEVFRNLLVLDSPAKSQPKPQHDNTAVSENVEAKNTAPRSEQDLAAIAAATPITTPIRLARSGVIGALIGMLPGAGADIAAWVSLAVSKRFSKRPELYGKGSLEGIADAATANSAALAGGWIPALVFGIPGDSVTAIVIGVLLMKNIQPGPEIFTKQATLVYSLYFVFILANLILLPVGWAAIRVGGLVVNVPRNVLLPVITLFCIVGAYSINGGYFDVGVMLAMGVLGFFLERRGIPLGPVVLGIILGGPLEERFVQTIVSTDGSFLAFFSRPMAAVLGVLCLTTWAVTFFVRTLKKRKSTRSGGA